MTPWDRHPNGQRFLINSRMDRSDPPALNVVPAVIGVRLVHRSVDLLGRFEEVREELDSSVAEMSKRDYV